MEKQHSHSYSCGKLEHANSVKIKASHLNVIEKYVENEVKMLENSETCRKIQ